MHGIFLIIILNFPERLSHIAIQTKYLQIHNDIYSLTTKKYER